MADLLSRRGGLLAVAVAALVFFVHYRSALAHNKHNDLFIYRAGAALGLEGRSPYDTAAVRERVVGQYPDDEQLAANLGFFLPPQAIVLFAPFAALPWDAAKLVWAAVAIGLAAWAALRLPVFSTGPVPPWAGPVLVVAVLLNPVTITGLIPGQTTVLAFACVVLGEAAQRRGWRWLAGFLWAVPFVKPHLALPLLVLAWYLGGWRRLAVLVGWLAAVNLAGCLVSTGSPWLLKDYFEYLSGGHKAVVFNRVATNPQITSWNRLLAAGGGPVVELSATGVLLGYAAWAGLVALRVRVAGSRPTTAWAVAAAFAGAVVCCQVMGYELVLLALALPHVLDLLLDRRYSLALALLAALGVASVPYESVAVWAENLRSSVGDRGVDLIRSHRAAGAVAFALGVLAGGWNGNART